MPSTWKSDMEFVTKYGLLFWKYFGKTVALALGFIVNVDQH